MPICHRATWRATAALIIILSSSSPLFADPITISQAIHRASETSPAVIQARGSVAAAEARARQAGVRLNPELGLAVESFAGTGPFRGFGQAETTLSVSQRFELGGKRSARRDLAEAELLTAQITFIQARIGAIGDARTRFAELSVARDRLRLASDAEARARELARVVGILVDAGREPPLRALRAQAAAAEAEAARRAAEANLSQAASALASVLGQADVLLEPEGPYDLSDIASIGPLTASTTAPSAGETLPVRLAMAERDAAQARLRLQQAAGVPDITGDLGVRRFEATRDVALVAGISIPIPIADRNRNAVQAARVEAELADARLAQARIENVRKIRDAQTALASANARVTALATSGLGQAREAVRLANIGYRAGKFSLLELIDAQDALNQAEAALLDARLARAQAAATLDKVLAQ